ncbi:MAG: hypothetical protein HQL47_09830 [Gammaproteobacteria bacterium]|nr:hypothetical protein [Gammaproteobacteria bacterium]
MNFLELVRDLYKESGESFSGGATATNADSSAVSYDALVAGWINAEWLSIQGLCAQWRWMWSEFNLTITSGVQDASLPTPTGKRSAIKSVDWGSGASLEPASDSTDYRYLIYLPYEGNEAVFRHASSGRPTHITQLPNGRIRFNRIPDQDYVLRGEGWLAPWSMTANADTPDMPERFHRLIVLGALLDHARWEASPEQLQIAMEQRRTLLGRMRRAEMPGPHYVVEALA